MSDLILPAFVSRAGLNLPFKFEADAISPASWENLAKAAAPRLPPFGPAVGVPRGGLILAQCMRKYADPDCGTVLLCEDIWTTGGSWVKTATAYVGKDNVYDAARVIGLVLLARGRTPPNVYAMFGSAAWLDVESWGSSNG